MTGMTMDINTAADLCRQIILKYGIQGSDALLLCEGIREHADSAEKAGFKEGFQMAQTIFGLTGSVEASERPTDVLYSEGEYDKAGGYGNGAYEDAFVRMEQNRNGKRLHFNKAAGRMFGDYRRADIFVRDGNIIIYPTNDGVYGVTRTAKNGHVQICCADIMDKLVSGNGKYMIEKRDNHIVARAPR